MRTAEAKLRSVHPTTVAITGSYGKTTTKVYFRHLASGVQTVLASPASFNNTGGLSRTLNEHLTPGTEVFVAEMGTFGPGEIRSMCAWVQPDIAAIVNIGPVHLERMKTLDGIVAAKAEIFEQPVTHTAVLNIDAHGLAALADTLAGKGKRVMRVSTVSTSVDVCVRPDDGQPGRSRSTSVASCATGSPTPPHSRPTSPPPSASPSPSTCRWISCSRGSTPCPTATTASRSCARRRA